MGIGPELSVWHIYLHIVVVLAADDRLVQEADRVMPELLEADDRVGLFGNGSNHLVPFFLLGQHSMTYLEVEAELLRVVQMHVIDDEQG